MYVCSYKKNIKKYTNNERVLYSQLILCIYYNDNYNFLYVSSRAINQNKTKKLIKNILHKKVIFIITKRHI